MDVGLISERLSATGKTNNLWINFLCEIERGPANVKGVTKGCTPTMHLEDGIDVVDCHGFNHGVNVTMPVSPRKQWILRPGWNNACQVLKSLDGEMAPLRNHEDRLNLSGFHCPGRRQV